jgi:hypothetical protein
VNIGAANDMDTFGKRILPQVIQEIRFSAYCARKLQLSGFNSLAMPQNLREDLEEQIVQCICYHVLYLPPLKLMRDTQRKKKPCIAGLLFL